MKVGIILPMFGADVRRVLEAAVQAEEGGYDGAFAFDHFFPPGAAPDRPALEAFATLSAVAAATERINVGTLVTRASLRPAGLLAKYAAAVQDISQGRFILGIGTGDALDRPEHETYGIPERSRAERRPHLAETVRALRLLFSGKPWPGGDLVGPLAGPLLPLPKAGRPPIWLGAQADEVVRMAAAIADGWNGWGLDVERFRAKATLLAEQAELNGRACDPTWGGIALVGRDDEETAKLVESRLARGMSVDDIWHGTTEEFASFLGGLRGAGAAWTAFVPAGPKDRAGVIAEEVLPALHRAAAQPAR